MIRKAIVTVIAATSLAACGLEGQDDATSETEQASSVHLKGGKNTKPSFFDHGLTLSTTAPISGLGVDDVVVTLDAAAIPDARCTNPAGATQPPGQNPAEVDISGSVAIPRDQIKNGNLTFTVTTEPPQTPVPGAPACPNPQWTQTIIDLAFTRATVTVEQPAFTTVLAISCSFSPPTSNGAVPAGQVSCSL